MVAAARGKANFVRALLQHGADINAEDVVIKILQLVNLYYYHAISLS